MIKILVLSSFVLIWSTVHTFAFDHPDTVDPFAPYMVEYACGAGPALSCANPVPRMDFDTPAWVRCDLKKNNSLKDGPYQCSHSVLMNYWNLDGYSFVTSELEL